MSNPIRYFLDFILAHNNITVPTGNYGVPRSQMPQIEKQHQKTYVQWLQSKGIKVTEKKALVSSLKLIQNEINKSKILKMITELRKNRDGFNTPIIVAKGGYVIDGSHRVVAQQNMDKYSTIKVYHVDMEPMELLSLSREFSNAKFRTVSGTKIDK